MLVSTTDLRANLRYYLDRLEEGEEITVLRNSAVIGRLVPTDESRAAAEARRLLVPDTIQLPDNKEVKFRQYGTYENPEPIQRLHQLALGKVGAYIEDPVLDADLQSPGDYYTNWGGEFWVGELEGEIVAMGAFKLHITGESDHNGGESRLRQAELKRMRVRPDIQGRGVGSALLRLLESRAKQQDYSALVLDTVVGTPAQQFYERHGYRETRRQQAEKFELVYFQKEL